MLYINMPRSCNKLKKTKCKDQAKCHWVLKKGCMKSECPKKPSRKSSRSCKKFNKTKIPKCNDQPGCHWVKKGCMNQQPRAVATPSLKKLQIIATKYQVSKNQKNKQTLALVIWQLRRSAISDKDLEIIVVFLPPTDQRAVKKLLKRRKDSPITNYRGMWKKPPMAISKMSRETLIRNLKAFRNAWEKITKRNQDLSDDRLNGESTQDLRNLIKYYFSDEARNIAEEWLRKA